MPQTRNLLLVSPDVKLAGEFAAALEGLAEHQLVTHTAPGYRQGVEAARSRRPEVALVEMTRDLRGLTAFAEELAVAAPETAVVAVFSPHLFGPDVSESAVLIEAMRAGVRDFLRRPLSSADLEGLFERLLRCPAAAAAELGKVVSLISNKGGVGKSTLSVNIACGLAQRYPERVLLIDASLQMGVCSTMLDLRPATSLTDAVRERDRLDQVLLRQLATPHECGLHLLAAPADAIEAAEVDDEVMARIVSLARRSYDFVLVDTFPLLDRVMLAILDLSDRSYLVLEGVVPTILGAVKLIEVLNSLGFPVERQGILLNRHSSFAGNLGPADVAGRLGRTIDHVLPYEKKLLIASNLGRPYILGAGRFFNRFRRALDRVLDEVEAVHPTHHRARTLGKEASANGEQKRERSMQ